MAQVEPRRVAKDDPRRLAVGVLSVGMSGGYRGFTGQAAILGPGVAVTTEGSANLRGEALNLWDEGSTVMSHVPSDDVAVDGELGFRTLRFAESHAVPFFARAVLPTLGAECRVLWYDYSRNDFFELTGLVAPGPGNRFNLHLEGEAGIALGGAPVFTDQFVVGIVVSGPPHVSKSVSHGPSIVEVLSVAVMAESKSTPMVRDLLRRAERDRSTAGPIQGVVRPVSSAKDATPSLSDPELWVRMSPSARNALARADGIRRALKKREVQTEYLIAGLFPSWRGFFSKAGVSEEDLRQIVRELFNNELPQNYDIPELSALPPLSKNLESALAEAAKNADERGSKSIWSRHLLYGALSVAGSKTVRALNERGVRREEIPPEDGYEDVGVVQSTVDLESVAREGAPSGEIASSQQGDRDSHVSQNEPTVAAGSAEAGSGEPRPDTSGPPDSRGRLSPKVSGPRHAVKRKTKSADPTDEELWSRMSESGRKVLERAEGMREAGLRDAIHMEHLVAAVFEDWRRFFERGSLPDSETLRQTIRHAAGKDLRMDARPRELSRLPALSKHARQALSAAANLAHIHQNQQISSGQILRGILITQCKVAQALRDKGLKESDLHPDDPSWTAAPTPKVDSDLWCEEDRLGYEAYARTIAALITHPETVAPLTIGIKAPWGAGKTSLMKRVQHLLDGQSYLTEENRSGGRQQAGEWRMTLRELLKELKWTTQEEQTGLKKKNDAATESKLPSIANPEGKPYGLPPRITVWFNAWKYQTSEQIWAGMAHCIISQVTARMTPRDRELFWLRLHARRVNADEVRRKIYDAVLRQIFPFSLMVMVACGVVVWVVAASPMIPLPHVWQGVTVLGGLFGVIWKAWDKLGDKAASTVKELVREPDYAGKMGYLHLVESDIREVLNLVTAAGAKAPENPRAGDAALKGRSSTVSSASVTDSKSPLLAAQDPRAVETRSEGRARQKPDPLVVFVDDLDRCAPNKVAEVVEAINLFLCGDYPNCIFVLGMEPGMVAAALEVANKDVIGKAKEMGLVDGAAPVGWRFMEKIVQMPVMIPPPTKHGRDAYVKSLVGSAGGTNGNAAAEGTAAPAAVTPAKSAEVPKREPPKEEDVQAFAEQMKGATLAEVEKKSLEIVESAPAEKRQAAAEAGKRVYAQTFSERDPMIADFVQECAELVDGNPRQIKRYVNVFRFYSTLRYGLKADGVATESELPNDKVLAKFVSMSIQWPHAMDCLRCRHATDEKGQTISRLEHLETKSAEIRGDDAEGDATWKELVGEKGMGLESWAHARAFRMFLARGESLGKSRGHGLW